MCKSLLRFETALLFAVPACSKLLQSSRDHSPETYLIACFTKKSTSNDSLKIPRDPKYLGPLNKQSILRHEFPIQVTGRVSDTSEQSFEVRGNREPQDTKKILGLDTFQLQILMYIAVFRRYPVLSTEREVRTLYPTNKRQYTARMMPSFRVPLATSRQLLPFTLRLAFLSSIPGQLISKTTIQHGTPRDSACTVHHHAA